MKINNIPDLAEILIGWSIYKDLPWYKTERQIDEINNWYLWFWDKIRYPFSSSRREKVEYFLRKFNWKPILLKYILEFLHISYFENLEEQKRIIKALNKYFLVSSWIEIKSDEKWNLFIILPAYLFYTNYWIKDKSPFLNIKIIENKIWFKE